MEHECPSCGREFKEIYDYPLVFVKQVRRIEVPKTLVLPDFDHMIYVGSQRKCGNDKPPQEVEAYFKENKKAKEFEYGGCTWRLEGKPESGSYYRSRKNVKDVIVARLTPYFDKLESLVGKEVLTAEVLLGPEDSQLGSHGIANTNYYLDTQDLDHDWTERYMLERNLQIPNLTTQKGTRRVAFMIAQSDGGSISEVHHFAVVGGLAYEGRLKK